MSRLASKPILFDKALTLSVAEGRVLVKGAKGELTVPVPEGIEVKVEGSGIWVNRKQDQHKPLQGLTWSLIRNAVVGLTTGYSKKIEVVGKGWRCAVKGDLIDFQVGYSHPVDYKLPKGVTATQENPGNFTLFSYDKHLLGQVCANIQRIRPVEPYKLKGIRIAGQPLRQKVRKAAGA